MQLENLSFSRLSSFESGQHVKNLLELLNANITVSAAALGTYLTKLHTASESYHAGIMLVRKSDETIRIFEADTHRDHAIITLMRCLDVFEYSPVAAEKEAYLSLNTLLNAYRGVQDWNYMAETNGINHLLSDLEKPQYVPHVALLGMQVHIDRLAAANALFESFFGKRTMEFAGKPVYNMKLLRKGMQDNYDDMVNYVVTMAKSYPDDLQFTNALKFINIERNYFSGLIAARQGRG